MKRNYHNLENVIKRVKSAKIQSTIFRHTRYQMKLWHLIIDQINTYHTW